jgi:hypothetical protein
MTLETIIQSTVGAVISYFMWALQQRSNAIDRRLEALEMKVVNKMDGAETRQLVEDLQRPLKVKIDEIQKDIKESKEDSRYIRDKIDKLIDKL